MTKSGFIESLESMIEYEFNPVGGLFKSEESIKWYDHEDDLNRITGANPGLVLYIKGTGEEQGDVWCAYAYNGKFDRRKAVLTMDTTLPIYLINEYENHSDIFEQINNID